MLVEGFSFATGLRDVDTWQDYLRRVDRYQYGTEAPWVPATFLVADVDGRIVGRSSIRFELDPLLAREGGHIGYGVILSERRKGYATEILIQSLDILFRAGIQRVLLTCGTDNEGSAKVIQRCGGVHESVVTSTHGQLIRRYWIEQQIESGHNRATSSRSWSLRLAGPTRTVSGWREEPWRQHSDSNRLPIRDDGDSRQVDKRRGVSADKNPIGREGGGRDDEVVSASGATLTAYEAKKIGVRPGDREIVIQNRY